jgi:hypothetical protein
MHSAMVVRRVPFRHKQRLLLKSHPDSAVKRLRQLIFAQAGYWFQKFVSSQLSSVPLEFKN